MRHSPQIHTPLGYKFKAMTYISSMEKRYCKRCNATKDTDLFFENRKYCIRCLEKEKEKHQRHREKRLEYFEKYYEEHKEEIKEYKKGQSQIEIECEVCKCKMENCNWANHVLTNKHKNNLDKLVE